MAAELIDSPSRVLITSRRPLSALSSDAACVVRLGPLPAGEAALYLREHEGLSPLFFHSEAEERALSLRLLTASRFHPLLMDRLARLASGGPGLRPRLLQALTTLEQTKDFESLPALFACRTPIEMSHRVPDRNITLVSFLEMRWASCD